MNRTRDAAAQTGTMSVRYLGGERYEIAVRDHTISVDQPVDGGGEDVAPTATELFVASLAGCVAFYAGRNLTRRGLSRDGLGVAAAYRMATDRPARVTDIRLTVRVPSALPPDRWPPLRAVVEHCAVHNTLNNPPEVCIRLESV